MLKTSSAVVSFRYGMRRPATWIWLALFAVLCAGWVWVPDKADLPLWQQVAAPAALALGLLWAEIRLRPVDEFLKKRPAVLLPVLSALAFLQTEIANGNDFSQMNVLAGIWCAGVALALYLLLYALLGRMWRGAVAGSVLFLIWSIGGYYTLLLRGVPLMPSDLFSVGTAAGVLKNYQLSFTAEVAAILCLFGCILAMAVALRGPERGRGWRWRLGSAVGAVVWLVVFCTSTVAGFLGIQLYEWSWTATYGRNGYLETTVLKAEKLRYIAPDGYSTDLVEEMLQEMEPAESPQQTPDVILILNESWFDWRQVTDFTSNRDITPFIDQLDNSIKGYAVGPQLESGTSHSEYELLTSNSTMLMPSITPFTQHNMQNTNSLPQHLKQLGYSAIAFHPATGSNYNRVAVYKQLGFESAQFWLWDAREDIPYMPWDDVVWVHGGFSDESCFTWIERAYEDRDTSKPSFIYNLTFQNHGSYEQADFNGGGWEVDPDNRVVVSDGFEDQRDQAEEYLSSVTYTDQAFQGLVEYFQNQEDPVIICMVGDHAPRFATSPDSSYEDLEYQLHARGTPFVIWANFPLEEQEVGYIGMPQLVPLLLESAGIQLSPYYQSLLELSEEMPVISRDFYQLADGELFPYTVEDVPNLSQLAQRYFYFENNALQKPASKNETLFAPWNAA